MEKKKYYKNLFLLASIWNIAVCIVLVVLSLVTPELITLFGVQMPPSLVHLQMIFITIGIFGIGFIIVYLDIKSNHGIVQMGIIEKVSFFVIYFIYFLIGDVGFLVLMMIFVDLIFGILFIEFLLNFKDS